MPDRFPRAATWRRPLLVLATLVALLPVGGCECLFEVALSHLDDDCHSHRYTVVERPRCR